MRLRRGLALAGALILILAGVCDRPGSAAADPALPSGYQDEVVFEDLEQPTNFRFAPDGERVFVAEKSGVIKVYDDLEDSSPEVFADLRGDVYDFGDRGLLGLALDPEFESGRPYVYALYTWDHVLGKPWNPADPEYGAPGVSGDPGCPSQNSSASCLVSGRLVRLTEDVLNPNHAVEEGGRPKEEELLGGWCQQFSSHSVGDLEFGPEGALYVSGGDGAAYESIPDYGQLGTPPNPCGDPPTPAGTAPSPIEQSEGGALRSQNLSLLNGAILRVDPDTGDAVAGNPLDGDGGENAERTVATGFRNPFRFALDLQTGEIYSGNVGSSEIEEIDRFQAPPSTLFNSGWPCYEGIQHQFQFRELGLDVCEELYESGSTSLPFFSYSHSQSVVPGDECPMESGSAISGISLYEGGQMPGYERALFFADAVRGCFWVMPPGEDGRPDPDRAERFLREGRVYPGVKIAEGPDGYLYYASLFSEEGSGKGEIHRIAYRPGAPTARLEVDPAFGEYDGGEFETVLDAGESTDPTGDPLTYEWDLDEDGGYEVSGGGETQAVTFTEAEQEQREDDEESPNRVVKVRVVDAGGLSSVARVTVYPGDVPPTATIDAPSPSYRWRVGDEIELDASAEDSEGHPITTPLSYYWITRTAHCPAPAHPTACHVHPLQTFSGIRRPEFVAPQHDYPSYIEALLWVSDGRGLSGFARSEILPRTVSISATSDPPGIELLVGSTEKAAPFSATEIEGSEILISAPATAQVGERKYAWRGWSDGGSRSHPVLADADASYEAYYSALPVDEPTDRDGDEPPPRRDRVAPRTKLTGHPAKRTRERSATFAFSASEPGARFRCKLDRRAYVSCRSPWTRKRLSQGRHVVKIAALDAAGNRDATPVAFSWRVLGPKNG